MKFVIATLTLLASLQTFAKDDHTPNVCSATDAKVCAHLGHMANMKAKSESSFMVDILVPKPVSGLTVELWMPEHGHGSTPVAIAPEKGGTKFKVTKANFSMPGNWVVRLAFDANGANHKIEIPLTIEK